MFTDRVFRISSLLFTLGIIFFALSAQAEYKRINDPNAKDLMDVHIYELDNGLTVYLTENHETPRFYAEISVRAGSKHDPANGTGLAHYLEHLLFKGTQQMGTLDYEKEKPYLDKITELYEQHFKETDTEKRKEIYAEINKVAQEAAQYAVPNEIDKVYNAMGGTHLNAHTWHEETVYKVGLPSNRLNQWAAVESARYVNPVFRIFHTELETVYEEKNRSIDNKDRLMNYTMSQLLYKEHPYGQQPTIGTVEHLKNPSLLFIYNYFNTYYVPNNMCITISGDINIPEAIKVIDENFSSWERKKLPKVGPWKEKSFNGVERETIKYLGEEQVEIAFRTVKHGHKDEYALRLLDMILDNSVAGLINLNLNQQQAVRRAGSYPRVMNDYGSQHLMGIPKEGQTLEEVENLLLDQLELIKKGEFEDWILPAIVTDFKKNEKGALESNLARVSAMRTAFLSYTDWDDTLEELDKIAKVTKKDVVRVANKYFGDNYAAVYRIDEQHDLPSVDKPQIDPVDIDPKRQSAFAKKILEMPFDQIEPTFVDPETDIQLVEYAPGVKLYYSPNPLNDLYSFSIGVEFGTEEDNKIGTAMNLLDKSGTKNFSPQELKKEWYKLGSSFGIGAGENESSMRISGLDEKFDETLGLMMDLVRNPTADDATLEEMKAIILKSREDAKKDPGAISRAVTLYNRHQEESRMLRALSSDEISKLTVDELLAPVSNLLNYEHTISYTGSLPLSEVLSILEKHHPVKGDLIQPPEYKHRYTRNYDETEIYFFNKEMAQAQVRIEFPDGTYNHGDATPASLYNSYFAGGMSGIVFQELREARALAYSAGARYIEGSRLKAENVMVGVIGCQADKTIDALEAFLDLFNNLPESEERFAENVNALTNRYRTSKIGFRGVIGAVRGWEKLGLDEDPRKNWFDELQSASIEDMLEFQKSHIKGKPHLISIVGDKNKIDMEALAKFGKITEVTIDQIFVD
jgi:predicted Zn-dependent peptidase